MEIFRNKIIWIINTDFIKCSCRNCIKWPWKTILKCYASSGITATLIYRPRLTLNGFKGSILLNCWPVNICFAVFFRLFKSRAVNRKRLNSRTRRSVRIGCTVQNHRCFFLTCTADNTHYSSVVAHYNHCTLHGFIRHTLIVFIYIFHWILNIKINCCINLQAAAVNKVMSFSACISHFL